MRPRKPVEHVDHVVRGERSPGLGRQRLARVLVDHGQHAHPAAVMQLVVTEEHAPPLVPARRHDRRAASHHRLPAPRSISPEIHAFHAIEPLRALVVDQPALASQQHVDPRRAPARAHRGDLLDPHAKPLLPGPDGHVADRRPRRAQHAARTPLRHPVGIACVPDKPTALAGRQTFFRSTSCRIALSRLRSATSRFSLAFSSSSCFSRRTSATPIAPNFFFHR